MRIKHRVEWGKNGGEGKGSIISISRIMFLHSHVLLGGLKKKKESSRIFKHMQLDAFGCFLPIFASDPHGQFYCNKIKWLCKQRERHLEPEHIKARPPTETPGSPPVTSVLELKRGQRDTGSAVHPSTDSMYVRSSRFSVTQTQAGGEKGWGVGGGRGRATSAQTGLSFCTVTRQGLKLPLIMKR